MAITIDKYCEENARNIWSNEENAHKSYRKIVLFSKFSDFDTRLITEYLPSHIYSFFNFLEDELDFSDATINRYHSALNSVFKHYNHQHKTDILPKVSWKKEDQGRVRFFSETEINQLLLFFNKSIHPWIADYVLFMLKTGMRRGEVNGIGLTKEQVGKNGCYGTIFVDHKTGRKAVHLKKTKNNDDRIVPLSETAEAALKNLDFCPSLYFRHHAYYDSWRYAREKICPNDHTFVSHVCRHTAGTNLASSKYNDTQIGRFLGHKSPLTTKKYVHEDRETTLRMVDSL